MIAKALELRDKGTFIPLLAIDMNPSWCTDFNDPIDADRQRYLLRRCGYPCDGKPNITITPLRADGSPATNDPYWWRDRTYKVAHDYIIDHWTALRDGDVIDVEFILGETFDKKRSERESAYD